MNIMENIWTKRVRALIIAIGIISFWRGIWGLMDLYLYPDNLSLSYTISAVGGLVILVGTHHVISEFMGKQNV